MSDLLSSIFTNPDVLTPRTVLELFVFFCIIEVIGMFFSWVQMRR